MDASDIANRMKNYESVSKNTLMQRMPVIIRIDGKAFHSFTKGFNKPFDDVLIKTMQETTKYLCENIQNCVFAYTQSDEISLLLIDYYNLNTEPWFSYKVQKMCSISASMATMAFNRIFEKTARNFAYDCWFDPDDDNFGDMIVKGRENDYERFEKFYLSKFSSAMFDSRCFNLPKEEVVNYFYWRQLDATRNSIQMVGQSNFSHRELQNKSCNNIQDMLMIQKGINWNDLPAYLKRGTCVIKNHYIEANSDEKTERSRWIIDKDIPIFKGDGRDYIEILL